MSAPDNWDHIGMREGVPRGARRVRVLLAIAVAMFASTPVRAQAADQRMTVLHLNQSAERSVIRDLLRIELRVAEAGAALDHRAASIADRMHLAVVRFRDVRVGNAETGGRPVPRFTAMAMAAPVAEPGEAMVRVTIEAELLLAAPRP